MNRRWAIAITSVLIAALVGGGAWAAYRSSKAHHNAASAEGQQVHDETRVIEIDGEEYPVDPNLETVMFIGLDDKYGEPRGEKDEDKYGDKYPDLPINDKPRADYVSIIVLDHHEKKFTVLHLDNSTLCDIPVLDQQGEVADWQPGQLYLSHTYGSDETDSCRNVKRTVDRLLYGAPVDHYFSIYIDAMPVLNHAVGGVTVDIKDDFGGSVDLQTGKIVPGCDKMTPGARVHLTDDQAKAYVRKLQHGGPYDDNHLRRMERQNQYMTEWFKVAPAALEKEPDAVTDALVEISDYLTSDMSVYVLADMIEAATEYEMEDIVTPEGEVRTDGLEIDGTVHGTQGDTVTLEVDENKLKKLVIELFCQGQ